MKAVQTIRSKILVPFIVILSLLTIISLVIMILFMNQFMSHRSADLLKASGQLKQQNIQTYYKEVTVFGQWVEGVSSKTIPNLKKLFESKSADLNNLSFDQFTFFYNEDDWPESVKKIVTDIPESQRTWQQVAVHQDHLNEDWMITYVLKQGLRSGIPFVFQYSLNSALQSSNPEIQQIWFFKNQSDVGPLLWSLNPRSDDLNLTQFVETFSQKIIKGLDTLTQNMIQETRIGFFDYLYVVQPSMLNPNLVGISIQSQKYLFLSKLKFMAIILSVIGLIGVVLYFIYDVIVQKITTSIDVLSDVSQKVTDGDFNQAIYIDSVDELGQLSKTFNKMIKQLKRSSMSLKDSINRSHSMIMCIPEPMIVLDKNHCVLFANQKAEQLFDFSFSNIKGKKVSEYIYNEEFLSAINDDNLHKLKLSSRDISLVDSSKKKRIFAMTATLVEDSDEEFSGTIALLRDQTRQRELEELRDGFLRMVSHELRTPLTSILGFLELLCKGKAGDVNDKQQHFLNTAHQESNNLKALIDDLLDMSQIRAGKIKLLYSTVNIKEFLDNVIISFNSLAGRKSLSLVVDVDDDSLEARFDSGKVRRILVNLISNAIKFTKEGNITVSCINRKKYLEFSVKDTGIGLMEEEKDIIFDRFRQVDFSATRQYEGIGLGLSIVKQLVEAHNGKVIVKSTYGKGSVFSFTIPKKLKVS